MKKNKQFTVILVLIILLMGLIPTWNLFNESLVKEDPERQLAGAGELPPSFAKVQIDGDEELETASTSGSGTPTDPYILQNYDEFLNDYDGNGILIQNTSKHFVLRNCVMRMPKIWYDAPDPPAAYVFRNVSNGRIEDCEMYGYCTGTPPPSHPTKFGYYFRNVNNITIDNCLVKNFQISLCPVAYGFYIYYGTNINVTNSYARAHVCLHLEECENVRATYNDFSGPLDTGGSFVDIAHGIFLYGVDNCIIEDNYIYADGLFPNPTGIELSYSNNVTIVNNTLPYSMWGDEIDLNPQDCTGISFIKLTSPGDDANYVGPMVPSPGYYPSSERFENYYYYGLSYPWPSEPDIINWNLYPNPLNATCALISNKTDGEGHDHKRVLECLTWEGTAYYADKQMTDWYATSLNGTFEIWFAREDDGDGTIEFQFIDGTAYDDPVTLSIVIDNGLFQYWNETSLNSTGISVAQNKWYRLSIDFCNDTSGYAGLGEQQYQFRIYDSDGQRVLYQSPAMDYLSGSSANFFQVYTQTEGTSNLTVYLDAPGYTWDSKYEIGDNAEEGLLLEFKYQHYGVDYNGFGYSIDGQPMKYLYDFLWGVPDPIKVIPVPDPDGMHTIQLSANATCPYNCHMGYSAEHTFTLDYFSTYLDIISHMENDEPTPPGLTTLTASENLNVSLTYKTRLGTEPKTNDTRTNVSFYYKINDNSWNGPYNLGYEYGPQNVSYLISNTLLNDFDHVYYYFKFEQYDNDSKYLDTFYWTRDSYELGAFRHNEWAARENAFHKKVAPIAYDLSLNYSVFYHAQVESTMENVSGEYRTEYPMVPVTNKNIKVDFHNISDDLSEYSVECLTNNSKLNHTLAQVTSNISTTTDPIFNYDQGIKSPFILPTGLSFSIGQNYTFPEMWFDSLQSGQNLTFTGDLFNLTYYGVEDCWPYSGRSVLIFGSPLNKTIIRYDEFTGIMVYFESLNDSVVNRSEKVIFALTYNNGDFPSNLVIDTRAEIVHEDIYIIPKHLLAIVYDPPGDHSYSQIKSGMTMTYGFEAETNYVLEDTFQMDFNILGFEVSDYIQEYFGCEDYQNREEGGVTYETVAEITFQKTLTSSTNTDNASLIGHGGGDLYYGSALIIHYYVMQYFDYVVIGDESQSTAAQARDLPNQQVDDILLWNGSFWVDYILELNSTFSVLGAYLDSYSHEVNGQTYAMSDLKSQNYFLDNYLTTAESSKVEFQSESPIFWTPDTYTEYLSSTAETRTITEYTIETDIPMDKAFEFSNSLSGGGGGMCVGILGGGVTSSVTVTITTTTVETTANQVNKEILCHLEDDDGTPIGIHDQFLMDMYKDKRFNTYGFIMHEDQTYTSRPFEAFSRDRRPPSTSELFDLPTYLQGTISLHCAAIDEETGVDYVEFYLDDDPIFDVDSLLIEKVFTPNSSNVYDLAWNTSTLEGIYYLFVRTYDNATPLSNSKISAAYQIQIDNTAPNICQARIYPPYGGAIDFYTNTLDDYSGISYVEYWDGDPTNPNSTLLGMSSDSSSSFNFIWATDPQTPDYATHSIYSRAYDRAGNYLDSVGIQVEIDTDCDGLSDIFESSLGTNALIADTDGDGYSDGLEYSSGTNPLDGNSYPSAIDLMSVLPVTLLCVLIGMVGVATFITWKHWRREEKQLTGEISKKGPKLATVTLKPLDILKQRLAKGEITQKEFIENKKLIES